MDGNLTLSVLSSLLGGSLVAFTTHLTTRKRTAAEAGKLEAEAGRIRVETTKLLLEVSTLRTASAPDIDPPPGWGLYGSDPGSYDVDTDHAISHSGTRSGHIYSRDNSSGFGTLMQVIKADRYRGKRLRLAGYIKTAKIEDWAGLWMRVDGPDDETLSFDNMQERTIRGTTEWTRYDVVLDVPEQASRIAFGLLLTGQGHAWVDDIDLAVVPSRVSTTAPTEHPENWPDHGVNLDFEA